MGISQILIGVAILWALAACDQTTPHVVLAQFLGGEGEVFVIDEDGRRTALAPGATIMPGQTVETAESATALIGLLPNMALQLRGATAVTVDSVRIKKNGNAMEYPVRGREAAVRLLRGSFTAATPGGFIDAELQVRTPAGVLIAPERSAFYAECVNGVVRVVNSAGRLSFTGTGEGAPRPLPAGYYIEFTATGRVAQDTRLAVVEESAAEQAAAAADTQELVSELTERLAAAPPPWRSR